MANEMLNIHVSTLNGKILKKDRIYKRYFLQCL